MSLIVTWKLVGKTTKLWISLSLIYVLQTEYATDKPLVDGRFGRAKRVKYFSEIERLNSLGNRILSWGKSPFVNVFVDFTIFNTVLA